MSGARQRPIPYQRLIYQLAPVEHAPLPVNRCMNNAVPQHISLSLPILK
jgi:hypothetical protein